MLKIFLCVFLELFTIFKINVLKSLFSKSVFLQEKFLKFYFVSCMAIFCPVSLYDLWSFIENWAFAKTATPLFWALGSAQNKGPRFSLFFFLSMHPTWVCVCERGKVCFCVCFPPYTWLLLNILISQSLTQFLLKVLDVQLYSSTCNILPQASAVPLKISYATVSTTTFYGLSQHEIQVMPFFLTELQIKQNRNLSFGQLTDRL